MSKKSIQSVFLERFVRKLIELSYDSSKDENKIVNRDEFLERVKETPVVQVQDGVRPRQKIIPATHTPRMPLRKKIRKTMTPVFNVERNQNSKVQTYNGLNLGKISGLLADPSVMSVECIGAMKNLVVNRSGRIQPTSIVLTKEEIDKIMEEISDKTRIPITTGLFKTAIQNLLVTAVVSEFVGSRFIILKRTPFRRYV